MPVKFGQTSIRFWFFLSYLITTVNLFQANIILSFLLQISVATFHIGRLELSQQSVGRHACIKVQAASLSGEECPAISWEEFQVIFYSV